MHRELKKAPDVPGLLGVTQPTPRYYPNVQIRQGAWIISQRQRRIASIIVTAHAAPEIATPCLRVHPSCLVENVNSGHSLPRERRRRCWPTRTGILLEVSAAMACPSGRVGEQLERHADKHRFPMRIRPGDRPPVQRSANRPLMWNCCRH
jgi:hypothetical protein